MAAARCLCGAASRCRGVSAESELAGFIGKFLPPMQEKIRACRTRMRDRFPDATELVYDNYNFLVIGFGPTSRTSQALFSLAADAHGVRLFFLQGGPELPDPAGILRGNGKMVRSVKLTSPDDLDGPEVSALIDAALEMSGSTMRSPGGAELIVKSVSAKQRSRR